MARRVSNTSVGKEAARVGTMGRRSVNRVSLVPTRRPGTEE
jgi:hypothetical protein